MGRGNFFERAIGWLGLHKPPKGSWRRSQLVRPAPKTTQLQSGSDDAVAAHKPNSEPQGTTVTSSIKKTGEEEAKQNGIEGPADKGSSPSFTPLDVVVVGAGIGGLAVGYLLGRAGHKVTILESASEVGEIGAGIQLSPNMTRLLIRWGVGEQLKAIAVVPQVLSFRRYEDGDLVGRKSWGNGIEKVHGSPYYHVHRADLHRILLDLAKPFVAIRLDSRVVDIDPSIPSITLTSGEIIETELIVGADGLHSRVRDSVVGKKDDPTPTGDAAYRAVIPTELMMPDSELKQLVDETGVNCWMGPGKHVVGYCIRSKQLYNVVMLHPARDTNEQVREASCEVMRADFANFEPRVRKLLDLVPSTMVWSLMDHQPLESWVHAEGKVCLLGDACHPMLPYRAQGAAMAVEDAAVLGNLLARIEHPTQLASLLQAYQYLRHPRATETQMASCMNQKIFHFDDGPEQRARDASMRVAMEAEIGEVKAAAGSKEEKEVFGGSANSWADREKNRIAFDYDADKAVEEWWNAAKEVL